MGIYEELENRGLVAQATNKEKVKNLLNNKKIFFYTGFEPTAKSLHVGHFVQILVMSRLQKVGHTPIILFGGGTGMIGDPTGKTEMRRMMTKQEIDYNIDCFKKQAGRFLDFSEDSPNKAVMINNADWLGNLNYIEFLRDIGVHFSVNRMLAAECYKQRLQRGLSFFELNYMVMQSYDFLYLNRAYDCLMELGGDDQWSNIIGGVELVRKVEKKEVYGLTFTLLTTHEGKKMGKTEKGALWLNPEMTSPYDFYQYWRNIDDKDVIKCFKMLTYLPIELIESYQTASDDINKLKEKLAFEITKLVHGEEEAEKVQNTSREIFELRSSCENMPTFILNEREISDGKANILDILVKSGLVPSKSEARRVVLQGGISVNGIKINDISFCVDRFSLEKGLIVKKGKKVYKRVILG